MNLFREVTFLFDQIHIPKRVEEEFSKRFQSRKILAKLLKDFAPFRLCNTADEISVKLLLAELAPHRSKPRYHEGEAEAVVQASQLGIPVVIVDDKRGRKWACARGLVCRGTLWVVDQLRSQELIPAIRPMTQILEHHNIRLPEKEVQRLLDKFSEA